MSKPTIKYMEAKRVIIDAIRKVVVHHQFSPQEHELLKWGLKNIKFGWFTIHADYDIFCDMIASLNPKYVKSSEGDEIMRVALNAFEAYMYSTRPMEPATGHKYVLQAVMSDNLYILERICPYNFTARDEDDPPVLSFVESMEALHILLEHNDNIRVYDFRDGDEHIPAIETMHKEEGRISRELMIRAGPGAIVKRADSTTVMTEAIRLYLNEPTEAWRKDNLWFVSNQCKKYRPEFIMDAMTYLQGDYERYKMVADVVMM